MRRLSPLVLLLAAAVVSLPTVASAHVLPARSTAPAASATAAKAPAAARPLALVYRGPAACPDGCSAAAVAMVRTAKEGFDVRYVGPKETLKLTAANLKSAALYVQPGGGDSSELAARQMQPYNKIISDYVRNGGRYLGMCMGGYLAGRPGFDLLPGNSGQFITSKGASVKSARDTTVQVTWRGKTRHMYFQDGSMFTLRGGATGVTVLARYTNNEIAALAATVGRGRVVVAGPHPEAPQSWYDYNSVTDKDGVDADLGRDMISTATR
jgi:glutamine amidotransferase-like uncharacterized protein